MMKADEMLEKLAKCKQIRDKTKSHFLKRDMNKQIKKLENELRRYGYVD